MPIIIESAMTHQLRRLRIARGWAIFRLAVEGQVSPTIITAVERHGYVPGPHVQQRLAKALQVEVKEIWPDPDEEPAT
jgi:lambda repressor-like predicted transcriptional regulator